MGRWTLILLPWLLWAQPVQFTTEISYTGESAIAIRTMTQAFVSSGYRLDLESADVRSGGGSLRGRVVGLKPFDPRIFAENLLESGVSVQQMGMRGETFSLAVEMRNGIWNVLLIGGDEGTELQKTVTPQWFRVQENQTVRIQPPYGSQWYPEIAVLDSAMNVLYSGRSARAEEEFQMLLPAGAAYLKVSNTNGMKLLREGMWIESLSPGR